MIKANIIRKSYMLNKILFRVITRLVNLSKKPYKKKKKLPRKKYSSLFILMRPNNTFVTVTSTGDKKKLHLITAGLSGFKGPLRSSPYSRHVVARKMSNYLYYNRHSCDIYFNSMITKKFFFFFKGLIAKPFLLDI